MKGKMNLALRLLREYRACSGFAIGSSVLLVAFSVFYTLFGCYLISSREHSSRNGQVDCLGAGSPALWYF